MRGCNAGILPAVVGEHTRRGFIRPLARPRVAGRMPALRAPLARRYAALVSCSAGSSMPSGICMALALAERWEKKRYMRMMSMALGALVDQAGLKRGLQTGASL